MSSPAPNRKPRKNRKDKYAYRDKLPFMAKGRRSGRRRNPIWWNVKPSGEYEADYKTGREYATAFWRVSGGRPTCGIDLGEILFAMHDPARPKSDRWDGLSGIEVSFIRTISEIMDIVIALPALVREGPKRLQLRQDNSPRHSHRRKACADPAWPNA